MDSIERMMQEHETILSFVKVVRSACCRVLEGEQIDQQDFRDMIQFARAYADRHHHGKEAQILFQRMEAYLGPVAVNLVRHGMLVEHDLGRMHLTELEKALERYESQPNTDDKLEILTQAAGWTDLLQRHIDKENNAAYAFARRGLPPQVLRQMDDEVDRFEAQHAQARQAALELLQRLREKYGG